MYRVRCRNTVSPEIAWPKPEFGKNLRIQNLERPDDVHLVNYKASAIRINRHTHLFLSSGHYCLKYFKPLVKVCFADGHTHPVKQHLQFLTMRCTFPLLDIDMDQMDPE